MSKTEYAWVIQRDDGKVFAGENSKGVILFFNDFEFNYLDCAMITKKECKNIINHYNLQNCRPVKCEIRVIGE